MIKQVLINGSLSVNLRSDRKTRNMIAFIDWQDAYVHVYMRICARINIRVYAKYARIICVCVVCIYLSCTVPHFKSLPMRKQAR